MKKFFSLFLITLSIIGFSYNGFSQINVYHVDGTRSFSDMEGVFYALPRTLIQIDLKVKKYEKYKGPYAEYARKYLDIDNVIQNDRNEYEIVDASISTITEADPDQFYFVDLSDKKNKNMMILNLNHYGLLQDMNGMLDKEFFTKEVGQYQSEYKVKDNIFQYSTSSKLYESVDTTIRKITIDTITVSKMYFDKIWLEKTDEKKASDAAKMIEEIRENKYNLLTGYQEVAYDGASMAYMHKELQRLEDEYLSLFTGVVVEKELNYSFTVLPNPDEEENMIPAFTFSERNGVHHATSTLGEIIYLNIQTAGLLQTIGEPLKIRDESEQKERGFYYRIPEKVNVVLEISNDLRLESDFLIPQFGVVTYLPARVSTAGFNPKTGNVSNIILE